MPGTSFSVALPNGADLNVPWHYAALALCIVGALPSLVTSFLNVLRQPEIQAACRWMGLVARRAWAALQASMAVPNARRRRSIADMGPTLMDCTLYYLFGVMFTAWFVFGVLLIAERWELLSPAKYALLLFYEIATALVARFYMERGRRLRVALRRRWRGLQHRRWRAAMVMACVPASATLVMIGVTCLRNGNATA